MKKIGITVALMALVLNASSAYAHCQVPCGIYDDHARIHLMQEHAMTLQKARKEIVNLQKISEIKKRNDNQMVRWVMTKEEHASQIQTIVNAYFFIQRIKLDWPVKKRNSMLNQLHKISVLAMKCKQSLEEKHYSELYAAINAFEKSYLKETKKK